MPVARRRSRSPRRQETEVVTASTMKPDSKLPLVIRPAGADNSLQTLKNYVRTNRDVLMELLLEHGGVLFRGWDIQQAQDFEDVSLILEPNLQDAYLGTSPRRAVTRYTFTASELPPIFPIPQHIEMSFLPRSSPPRIFFCCLHPSLEGGETPITDFGNVCRDLDPAVLERFRSKGVLNVRNYVGPTERQYDPWKLKRWPEIFETKEKAEVERICALDDVKVEWLKNDALRLTNKTEAVLKHPVTGRETWYNHSQVFHPSAAYGEYRRIAGRTGKWWQYAFALLLWLVVSVKLVFQGKMNQGMNTFYGDGSTISDSDMDKVRTAIWKNSMIYKWEKGDIAMLDNRAVSHGRLPFKGKRSVIVAWGGSK